MRSVRIVADGGCDLPADLVRQYDISVVPVYIRFGEEAILSNTIDVEDFWKRAVESPTPPGSAAPAPGGFATVFRRLVDLGHDVICLTLPRQQSATYDSALIAAQEFGEQVHVMDSGSITLGMGLQVVMAAKEALAGRSAEAIQHMLANLSGRVSVLFVLDTLEWVRRGGRLDGLMPLIERVARTFQVKPVVEMREGNMRLLGIARSHRSALARLEEEVRTRLPVESVAVMHTRGVAAATELKQRFVTLLNLAPADVMLQEAGPVFAAHAGPRALAAVVIIA